MPGTLTDLVNFFQSPPFIIIGGISAIILIIENVSLVWLTLKGILPILYRLGIGLSKRKIAVFAESEYESLNNLLKDSGIFDGKNIIQVHKNSLGRAQSATIFLVHWREFKEVISDILSKKDDSVALIVYAPPNEGLIDAVSMSAINEHRNTVVVNFRGRLLNDVLTSLITTGFKAK